MKAVVYIEEADEKDIPKLNSLFARLKYLVKRNGLGPGTIEIFGESLRFTGCRKENKETQKPEQEIALPKEEPKIYVKNSKPHHKASSAKKSMAFVQQCRVCHRAREPGAYRHLWQSQEKFSMLELATAEQIECHKCRKPKGVRKEVPKKEVGVAKSHKKVGVS